ncbi:trigger factor [Ruminococcus sp. AF34-12]|jgi:trigger factor|uniref:trigger factor n=1 Tax=unclassified Ruminococcus TaxID=2608920 RepID=UPI000E4E7766|nr:MULTISPECIES: trigger factor [unclassified Ruminococcus]RGF66056.1 trigger factor [Ruminococcus sp. AF34-12]RGG67848.1 trigger factor [Ruminococcus sp. AF18-29]UYJ31207.1 MAG: trigger factor [Oscillospiraceae bacterium]MBU5407566.1 trigger factor [Ruminococcus sp. MSJ-25]RGF47444.1 trigger factor [Ruminococcus sp. AF37-20]
MSLKATNNVETNKYELEIEISAEDFEAAIEKAYLKARKNIAMPGFRKGKAPRKLIEKEYGEQVFFEDAVNLLYAPVVNGAVEESGLELVTRPEVEVTEISKENGVKLKATCITKPEVEVKDYKGIEVEKVVNPVTDEDINKQLDALREKNVTVETVDDRAAENGDDVVIDFEGFKDDVAFEGGKAEDFTLSLGSGQFIPGFEDQIVGHNAGEEFDINVTFPEEYQVKELAGAPAVFKIKLKSISKKVMPELDDDMVKDSTEFDTVDEYKADVKKKLEEANEKHADSEVEAKIFDKVIENMTAEIPQVMFDNRVNEMISELEQRLAPQGISLDLYMQYTGQTMDTVKKAYAEQAEKQVKLRLALEKIAKLENIEVTEDELKAEFDKLAEAYKLDVDQIKQFIHDDDLKKDIAVGKAVDLIKDAAVIK